jgi:exosortase A
VRQAVSTPGWQIAGPVTAGLLLLVLLFYRETTQHILHVWNQLESGEYAHGYLVLAISLYLVYTRRRSLAVLVPCPAVLALPAVVAASLLWLAGSLADVQLVQVAALLLVVMTVVWAVLGTPAARQLVFPVLFIGLALPLWSPLSPLLQGLTADAVFWPVRAVGIPALRQENLIILPAGTLSIEESCSGLRYLLAALTLGVLYAWLYYRRLAARLTVVLVAVFAALLANVLRVFIVVYVADKTAMQHPWVDDHLSVGWFLFGGLVFLLLAVDIVVSRQRTAATIAPREVDRLGARQTAHCGLLFLLSVAGVASVLAMSGPVLAAWADARPATAREFRLEFPAVTGWSGPLSTTDSWMPVFQGALAGKRMYQNDSNVLYLYAGFYPWQSQGKELINDLNRLADGKLWRPVHPQVQTAHHREQVLETASGQRRLAWYWYRVTGRHTTSEYLAKLLQLRGILEGNRQASVIVIAADFDENADAARQVLAEFLSAAGPSLAGIAVEQ